MDANLVRVGVLHARTIEFLEYLLSVRHRAAQHGIILEVLPTIAMKCRTASWAFDVASEAARTDSMRVSKTSMACSFRMTVAVSRVDVAEVAFH